MTLSADAPEGLVALTGARVITMTDDNGGVIEDGVVVIDGNRIVAVGSAGSVEIPDGAQTVDAAYTILDTGIGERSTATDIQHVVVGDLPVDPAAEGYLKLARLADYISWHKSKHAAT